MSRAAATKLQGAPLHRLGRRNSVSAPRMLRLRVYLTRGSLDRKLATVGAVGQSEALALRALQLISARTRQQTARNLRGTVKYAARTRSRPVLSAVVIDHTAVIAGQEAILGLAERLEGTAPVTARGVALARELLTDGQSPLFNPHTQRTVTDAVWKVGDALDVWEPADAIEPPAGP